MKINLKDIRFITREDGSPLNPRGEIRDTTSLQLSMAKDGQQEPIRVAEAFAPGGAGVVLLDHYVVLRGHRRVVAARALGWSEIEAEIVHDDNILIDMAGIFRFMLSDFVREDLVPTQVGAAIRDLLGFGATELDASHTLGLKPDKALLYLSLLDAPPSVQARVDAKDMSMKAYEAIRNLGSEIQERAAALEKPTVKAVREEKQKAKAEARGQQVSMVDQMGATVEHALLAELRQVRVSVHRSWSDLGENEKGLAVQILRDLLDWTGADRGESVLAGTSPEPLDWKEVADKLKVDADQVPLEDFDIPWDEDLAREAESELGAFGKLDDYSEVSLRPDRDQSADWDTAWDTGEEIDI